MAEHDILVAGGGIAGLTAALALHRTGARVICVDAAPRPALDPDAPGADLRTTAFLMPAIRLLESIGVWQRLQGRTAPLRTMRLLDAGGQVQEERFRADFDAAELNRDAFGENVANTAIRAALLAEAEAGGLDLHFGAAVTGFTPRDDTALVRLSTGETLRARLAVAADGRDSALRSLAGLTARRWDYGQKALVFSVAHDLPHDGVSTEIHRTGGPFTLVPMPEAGGEQRSSVVWMCPGPRAAALMALDDAAFAEAVNVESLGTLGRLELRGRRALWPIVSQVAPRLDAPRCVLVAEAAHVVPPIGAQGLNMSLADIAALADLVGEAHHQGRDPGGAEVTGTYHRRRIGEIGLRVGGIDLLNRAALAEAQPLRDLRAFGLRTLHGFPPLRHLAMRLGLGG